MINKHSPVAINRAKNNAALLLSLFLLFVTACANHNTHSSTARMLSPAQMAQSLESVIGHVNHAHPQTVQGLPVAMKRTIGILQARASEPMAEAQFMIELNGVLATLRDGHSEVRPRDDTSDFLDLDLLWNSRGLIVLEDSSELRRGDRVISMGGKSEQTLLDELSKIVPAENIFSVRHRGAHLLTRGDHLRWLGLVAEGDKVQVVVERDAETKISTNMQLGPALIGQADDPWFGFKLYPQESLGHFWFRKFDYTPELIEEIEQFFAAVSEQGINKIAIDIRNNPGGNSIIAFDILQHFTGMDYQAFSAEVRISAELKEKNPAFAPDAISPIFEQAGMPAIQVDQASYIIPSPFIRAYMDSRLQAAERQAMRPVHGKSLFLLTDGGTFSSSNLFAVLVRDNQLGQIIGGPTGNSANFNGMEMRFDVPNTNYYLNLPSGRLNRPDGLRGNETAIYPDVPVFDTAGSVRDGIDPQIEYLRSLSSQEESSLLLTGLTGQLDGFLDSLIAGNETGQLKSVALRVEVPSQDYVYVGSAGIARADSDAPMLPESPFFVASITKTFVAATTLRLIEEGMFTLDTSLGELGVFTPQTLERLQVFDGVSYGADLTIRQLLTHRSGLWDYLLDDRAGIGKDHDGGSAPGALVGIWKDQLPEYLTCLAQDGQCEPAHMAQLYPGRTWAPWNANAYTSNPHDKEAGMLNFYLSELGGSAWGPPGGDAHYSDTNFMLMGVIIQELTGDSLQHVLDKWIFTPMGMASTYMAYSSESVQQNWVSTASDFYSSGIPVISTGLDISWDWGGGGLVSTAGDLAIFLRGIVEGDFFRDQKSRAAMQDFLPVAVNGDGQVTVGYGLGFRFRKTDLGPMWGHSGAWGSEMEYYPDYGIFITGTINNYASGKMKALLVTEPVTILKSHLADLP